METGTCLLDKFIVDFSYQKVTEISRMAKQYQNNIKILFVCHGNICRSPLAEYILRDMVTKRGDSAGFYIASAATSTEEIGNPVYPPARRKLQEHGISCDGKRAVQLKKSDYAEYDYLLGMEERNIINMKRILCEIQKERYTVFSIFPIVRETLRIPGTAVILTRPMRISGRVAKHF
mgnify:CR=1 FL=1